MTKMIHSVKGTRDFYPEDMAIRNWLYGEIREVSESFGYQEYEGPLLEPIELYAAKSGEELVKEQSFVFPDKGGDWITLRPELTPTLTRMIAQRQKQLTYPLRWWSFGPFWRYERPQKGRGREFFQWNIDFIGVDTPEADAEIVAVAAAFLRKVGLTPDEVKILVNNRQLMDSKLGEMGVADALRPQVFRLIDRRDRMAPKKWAAYGRELGLSDAQLSGLQALLVNDRLWESSPALSRFFTVVEALGAGEYVRYDPRIIRGLDYYTGTVFECWDRDGEFRAILGGGRYDNLVADVGGEPLPAVGYAMGDMVSLLVIDKFGHLPTGLGISPAPILVTVFDEELLLESIALGAELRRQGFRVACYPEPARINKQFKFADRIGARLALILGPDEIAAGTVAVKNLVDRQQNSYPRSELAGALAAALDRPSA